MAELMAKWVWALSRTWSCPLGVDPSGFVFGSWLFKGFESFLPSPYYFRRRFLCSKMELFPGEGKVIFESKYLWDALRVGHKMTTDFWKSIFLGEILTYFSSHVPLPLHAPFL